MENIRKQAILIGTFALLAISLPVFGAPTYEYPALRSIAAVQSSTLLPIASPVSPERVMDSTDMIITAYSSTPGETDDTPFITAYGTEVRPGIVATNDLPYGTRIRIPSIYGEKVFTVEDRMNARKRFQIDIWFPTSQTAKEFGVQYANIEILKTI